MTLKITYADRLNKVEDSVFDPIFKLVGEKVKRNEKILNAAVGIPDSDTAPLLLKTLEEAVYKKENMRYSDFHGKKPLLAEISKYLKEKYNVDVDPETEVALLLGTKSGISILPEVLLNDGDVALVPDPGFPDYVLGIQLANGKVEKIQLKEENGYLVDFDAIDEEISKQAKFIFLNYPSNPIGAVATPEFFEKAVAWAKKYDVLVAHDHAYSDFYYGEGISPSYLQAAGAKDVGIEFFSLSKNFSVSGLRIGFVVGHKDVIAGFKKHHTIFHANIYGAVQDLALVALQNAKELTASIRETYTNRVEKITTGLRKIGYDFYKPEGSIFIWLKVKEGYTSKQYFEILLNDHNVVTIPGTAFGEGGEGYLRISISLTEEQIDELLEKLEKAYKEN